MWLFLRFLFFGGGEKDWKCRRCNYTLSLLQVYFTFTFTPSKKRTFKVYVVCTLRKKYKRGIFGKCTSFILLILKYTLRILLQTSVLVKEKCTLSILWNFKDTFWEYIRRQWSWYHFQTNVYDKSMPKVCFNLKIQFQRSSIEDIIEMM